MWQVKSQKAFSLVEVMVVVAILAILLLLALRQFGGELGRARDGQRKEDLRQLKLAFENYYNDHDSYPPVEYVEDCGGPSLQPYLREVPCDPVTGDPYLYLPDLVVGEDIHAYRLLSFLSNTQDPIVLQLGCQYGCGVPPEHPRHSFASDYIYGVAEGVPLVMSDYVAPTVTPTTVTTTPPPQGDPGLDCTTDLCFCCGGVNQTCNVYTTGYGQCVFGPFATASRCHELTVCNP